MLMHSKFLSKLRHSAFYFGIFLLSASVYSCGGSGAGGGGGNPASQNQDVILSGSVQAPGGQIAFSGSKGLFEDLAGIVIPSANALISGLSSVPDGTIVELDKIDDSGIILSTLSATTVASGRYSFNFTKLNFTFSSNLIVRIFHSSSGIQMRAFAGIGFTNINPASEASVRGVFKRIGLG